MPPFKSEAQRNKFLDMVRSGELSQSKFDEWNKDTPEQLPDRVPSKDKPKPFTKTTKVIK